MGGLLLWIFRFFKRKKWVLWLLIAGWLAVALAGISRLQFSEDIMQMLPADEDGISAAGALDASSFTDRVIFHLIADSTADESAIREAAQILIDSLETMQPRLLEAGPLRYEDERVAAMFEQVMSDLPYLLTDADFAWLDSLQNPEMINQRAEQNYRRIVSPTSILSAKYVVQDPLGLGGRVMQRLSSFDIDQQLELNDGLLTTADGRHVVLFVQPAFPANNSQLNTQLYDRIESVSDGIEQQFSGSITLEAFGAPLSASVNAAQIKEDIYFTVSLALVALLIVIFVFYRSLKVFLFILVPAFFGGASALAFFAWMDINVSLISVSIGSILLGITVDYALHVFTHFRSKGEVEHTLKDLVEPTLLSAFTTAAAFFTLLMLNAPAMQHLGLFAGVSVLVGAVAALVLLPHVLNESMQLPPERRNSFIDRFNTWRPDKNKYVVWGVLVLTGFFFWKSSGVGFESDLLKMNFTTEKLDRAERNLAEISDASLKQVLLLSSGDDWESALQTSAELDNWLDSAKAEGQIGSRSSLSTVLPTPSRAAERMEKWNGRVSSGDFDRIEEQLSNRAEELGMKPNAYRGFFERATSGFSLLNYAQWADLPLFSNFADADSSGVKLLTTVQLEQLHRPEITLAASQRSHVTVLDKQFITNRVIDLVQRDFEKLINFSLLIVFLILLLVYGRIELAIFTFLPMLTAWVWTLGLMNLFDMKFNIFNIIVSSFIFGLGIDYSIFISRSMIQQFKYGRDELVAYKNSIFLSAFTTTVGVGVLIFAEHPALRSIAAMALVGIGSMLVVTYTIQPLLYRWAMIDRKKRGLVPINAVNLFLGLFSLTYFFVGCIVLNLAIVLLQLVPVSGDRKRIMFRGLMSVFLGSLAAIMANVRREYRNPHNETFEKPAVVIANHQSFIDILITLNIQPNLVMVVKKWVYHSPVFGWAVRYAGHFHVNDGYEKFIPRLRELVEQGCSIVVFPEGTRSVDGKLNRFHKGAFYLAEQMQMDIVPMILHGNHYSMPKGDSHLLKNGYFHRVIEKRIPYTDRSWGETYQERTKSLSRHFKKRYRELSREFETPAYFRDQLMRNYILKGPVLEWYTRIKTRLEDNYTPLEKLLPRAGTIVDIGCGYGYLAHILAWTSEDRTVIGFDHDDDKIAVAQNTPTTTPNLSFEVRNVLQSEVPEADAYVIADVLHYLPQESQRELLVKCISNLKEGGLLLVRDADASLKERQRGTWLTEFFSTNFGFNRTNSNALCFVTRQFITDTVAEAGATVEVLDNTRYTSNIIYLIRKNG